MADIASRNTALALIVGHMAGMIDIAALPVWVGTLIAGYGLQPAEAGGLVTLFLAGIVVTSVLLSPFFHRLAGRWMPALGFLVSAAAFYAMTSMTGFAALAASHLIAGLGTGVAISFVHGTMALTPNPHRIFALGGLTLAIVAVVFLASAPILIAQSGPSTLFFILSCVMAVAALVTAALFPNASRGEDVLFRKTSFDRRVWFAIAGVMCMALIQAMIFSFVERIGADRAFSFEMVQRALVLSGFIAIAPPILATLLEKRLPPMKVAVAGATIQGLFAIILTWTTAYPLYLVFTAFFPFVILFTHTFVFGYLARLEPTGRVNAATPAMVMTGSATAPLLGGILVQTSGYGALGVAAAVFAAIAAFAFFRSGREG